MATVPPFSLRIRQPQLRALIREVAARENISQNELLEQAAEHEVVARGALVTDDLQAAAAHLTALTEAARHEAVLASVGAAAAGEALPDPLRARRIERPTDGDGPTDLIAVAAFQRR